MTIECPHCEDDPVPGPGRCMLCKGSGEVSRIRWAVIRTAALFLFTIFGDTPALIRSSDADWSYQVNNRIEALKHGE